MKNRSETSDKVQNSEQHRQLAQSNSSGDTHAPASPALLNGADTDKLTQLGKDFRNHHKVLGGHTTNLQAAYKMAVGEAVACGEILINAKALCKHGQWMDWLKQNAQVSDKTAQRYMRLAEKKEIVTNMNTQNLTEVYIALGLVKNPNESESAVETQSASTARKGGGQSSSKKHKPSELVKAKGWVNKLWELAERTDNPEQLAKDLEPLIKWHKEYLAKKEATAQKAKEDAAFETVVLANA